MSWAKMQWLKENIGGTPGGVKSVQRGVTAAAGTITIAPVDMNKAFVISASKGSTGTVATSGTLSGSLSGSISGNLSGNISGNMSVPGAQQFENNSITFGDNLEVARLITWGQPPAGGGAVSGTTGGTISGSISSPGLSGTISGGTTNLTAREFSARLTAETTIQCDGAVEWQVVEYY